MAIVTGIPPGVWADEGDRAIVTACVVIDERAEKAREVQPWPPGTG